MDRQLSQETLHLLPADIEVPSYDRSMTNHGVVHIGVGAFHRAHQAAYLDDCLSAGEKDWGIVGVSLRSKRTREALKPQDNLYTLGVRNTESESLRVIGSITNILVLEDNPDPIFTYLCHPSTRIVTLTVTEKGYCVNLATGELIRGLPEIEHDLINPHFPRSVPGILAEAIFRRRRNGIKPFTILSCDNLPSNGATLLKVLTQFCLERDTELGKYISGEVACPSSMVDRIVPATIDSDKHAINLKLGLTDAWPVVTEKFSQWVIEDHFPLGRPQLERSGVKFVAEVAPFEKMKLRMLNGAHSSIAAIGRIAGFVTVADAISNATIDQYIRMFWDEISPTISNTIDTKGYSMELVERFSNKSLHHRLDQIATDASQKIPQRLVAPLRELRAKGKATTILILSIAAWIRSCCGQGENGQPMPLNDPFIAAWPARPDQWNNSSSVIVEAYLNLTSLFGEDLKRDIHFKQELLWAYESLSRVGILTTLQKILDKGE